MMEAHYIPQLKPSIEKLEAAIANMAKVEEENKRLVKELQEEQRRIWGRT